LIKNCVHAAWAHLGAVVTIRWIPQVTVGPAVGPSAFAPGTPLAPLTTAPDLLAARPHRHPASRSSVESPSATASTAYRRGSFPSMPLHCRSPLDALSDSRRIPPPQLPHRRAGRLPPPHDDN